MAYKPEKIDNGPLTKGGRRRAAREAKKAATRLRRRAEKRDPEFAPTKFMKGWILVTRPGPIHYSTLARVTLCGKEVPFKQIKITDVRELVDCKDCIRRLELRDRIFEQHKAK